MPIVKDRSQDRVNITPDIPMHTRNRSVVGTPNGTLTPVQAGEIIFDTTNKVRWKATDTTNAGWRPMEAEVT